MNDLSVVETYGTRAEADTAKSLLDSQSIISFVSTVDAGAIDQAAQFSSGVRLLVNKKDLDRAKKLLLIDKD